MSEPMLEEIAADGPLPTSNPRGTMRVLARELLALRDRVRLREAVDKNLHASVTELKDEILHCVRTDLAEAYEKLTQNIREHYPPAFRILCAERDAARASAEKLREALEHWGAHGGACKWWTRNNANCTCGLQAALDQSDVS